MNFTLENLKKNREYYKTEIDDNNKKKLQKEEIKEDKEKESDKSEKSDSDKEN